MQMTASEKIARVFEIAGYVWLVPSMISLFYPLMMLLGSLLALSVPGFLYSIIPFLIFSAGFFLLIKYQRHSRGLLAENRIIPLWAGTMLFNLLLLAPAAYGFLVTLHTAKRPLNEGQTVIFFVWGLLIFWQSAAVLLSITAIMSELKNQKYR